MSPYVTSNSQQIHCTYEMFAFVTPPFGMGPCQTSCPLRNYVPNRSLRRGGVLPISETGQLALTVRSGGRKNGGRSALTRKFKNNT